MPIRNASAVALAGLLTIGALTAFAQEAFAPPSTPEEAVEMRQALMREDGGIVRSSGRLTGAEAVTAMETLETNYSHIPDLFPENSIVGDSKALPAIWENWDAFVAIVDKGRQAAADARAAAEAGDTATYAASLRAVGGTCGECHQQFRAE